MKKLNVWIDVTNSPHVLFFNPIINLLKKQGHNVIVTARDFAQTYELLEKYNIDYIKFGKYAGKNVFKKMLFLCNRSYYLYKFIKNKNINLSLSHNSVDICIVSKFLKIPVINAFDYEYAQFHHINFRCSTKILCPKQIPKKKLYKFGGKNKIIHYNGLKEQIYFFNYKFNKNILSELNLNSKKIIILLRPPADTSLYHRNVKNKFYYELIDYLGNLKNTQIIFLGRNSDQINYIKNKNYSNYIVLEKAIDVPSLIKKSDIVVSAGGTINREAVALGVPVYSILAIKLGAVDEFLIKTKKMFYLNDLTKLKLAKKNKIQQLNFINPQKIVDIYLKFAK